MILKTKREATRQELIDRINELQSKLKKKDKIIDKATRFLRDLQLSKDLEGYELMNANDWKQYFEKEIEMSEADKLFDELEFNKYELDTYIEYLNRKTREEITFRKDTRTVEKCRNVSSDYITMQELQAINKKCKELEWIE